MIKARLMSMDIQLHIVTDDGEHLTPVQTQPIPVYSSEWEEFAKTGVTRILADVEAQIQEADKEAEEPAEDSTDEITVTEEEAQSDA